MRGGHKGHKPISFGLFLADFSHFSPLWPPYHYGLMALMAPDTFASR